MPPPRDAIQPRTFFLNETHELSPVESGGGGKIPDYVGISWAAKAQRISKSIGQVLQAVRLSNDPLKDERYFVVAQPVTELEKRSKDKKKAPQGTFKEPTLFGDTHGKVFDRLGLDLLQVTSDGRAVVHGDKEKVEQLYQRSASLGSLGEREQNRWVTIDSFEMIPLHLRVDADWLKSLKQHQPSDIVIELQPVLTRVEADRVLRAIADLLTQQEGEKLTGSGTDFSGRYWFRGKATQRSVRLVAKDFFSVQAIHSPLYSIAAAKVSATPQRAAGRAAAPIVPADAKSLPCVAVVDLGVPADHKQLAHYRRGQFVPQDAPRPPVGDHGAFVASRVVFGECQSHDDLTNCVGRCSFYDAMVGDYPDNTGLANRVNDKIVMDAIRGVRGAAPDVRVFNLSFGDARPLNAFPDVERREKRLLLQDLDNFIFATDAIIVVAAGNSPPGVIPNPAYPDHHADPQWALGPWACGFNTLVCGSFVSRISANGLVTTAGWPSPFSRVGPGLCESPVPSFCAEGGNTDGTYRYRNGLGVWGFSGTGLPEDRVGTSHAAPLLAREAAITLNALRQYCVSGTEPFGVTVRAFLTLTAQKTTADHQIVDLAKRTLGHGKASSTRIITAKGGSAVILWQGFIESPKDTVRVQLPIPLDWLSKAKAPILRLAVCYDPPVNESAQATWACRRVKAVLHLGPEATYLRAPAGGHDTYPLFLREYKLGRFAPGNEKAAEGDLWLLELSYDEVFAYPPAMDFDPRQRVAFAAELIDDDEEPVDPQPAMQALPVAASMNRLSIQPTAVRNPVIVRTRVS
jgi:hypothetical protein